MNITRVVSEISKKYPGKKIILNTPDHTTEIICEIEPTALHPERSIAIAVVDVIRPHYHNKLTEIYTIIKGTLFHYMGDKKTILNETESITIPPGNIHWAQGKETWFYVYSTPGWTPDDHILVIENQEISRKKFDK
ncbi:MAG: cupin domain-containing protein [Patescibacteria group bacterium]